jgi:IS30 family transposase
MLDRRRFSTFLEMGLSIAEIANRLSKHPATLYRELNRNSEEERCLPKAAQLKTEERPKQKRLSKLKKMDTYEIMLLGVCKKDGAQNKSQDE